MLAVGARLAPDHRSGRRPRRAVGWTLLAVRLHLQLLEVGRQAPMPLVVGHDRVGRVAEGVAVPDAEQRHSTGMFGSTARCGSAGRSRRRRPELGEVLRPMRSRAAARWPTRPSSGRRPSPRTRTPASADAEVAPCRVGRDGREWSARGFAERRRDPGASRRGVGHGLLVVKVFDADEQGLAPGRGRQESR